MRQATRGGRAAQPVRLRRDSAGPLRPGARARRLQPRLAGPCPRQHVALHAAASGREPQRYRFAGRGNDAARPGSPPGGGPGGAEPLDQRRGRESDRLGRSSRPVLRRFDGLGSEHPGSEHLLGRRRGGGAGGICRGGRHRSNGCIAARREAGDLPSMPGLRRSGHLVRRCFAPGEGLRPRRAERALPPGRREDRRLRTGRTIPLGSPGCGSLSRGRGTGTDRRVEGVRGNGSGGLDFEQEAEDDRGRV